MKSAKIIHHSELYTLRVIGGGNGIELMYISYIESILKKGLELFELPGHLVVNIITGESITVNGGLPSYGIYTRGFKTITIATSCPENKTKESWMGSLAMTVLHELFHYKQDLEIDFDGNTNLESEAETAALNMYIQMGARTTAENFMLRFLNS